MFPTIYVLLLKGGNYYVGKTSRSVDKRFAEHLDGRGRGAAWTRLHPPIAVHEEYASDEAFEEDATVKEYMQRFGIDNVRGGAYSELTLSADVIRLLEREMRHDSDQCLHCGSSDHFCRDCPDRLIQNGGPGHRNPPSYDRNESIRQNNDEGDNQGVCRGTKQDGTNCRRNRYLNGQGYCHHHKDQHSNSTVARISPERDPRQELPVPVAHRNHSVRRLNGDDGNQGVCCGVKQDGTPCQIFLNLNAQGYCHHHKEQHSPSTVARIPRGDDPRQGPPVAPRNDSFRRKNANNGNQSVCRGVKRDGTPGARLSRGQEPPVAPRTDPFRRKNGNNVNQGVCRGVNQNGTPVARMSQEHNPRQEQSAAPRNNGNQGVCCGVRQDGTPCQQFKYLNAHGYCSHHANQYRPPTDARTSRGSDTKPPAAKRRKR